MGVKIVCDSTAYLPQEYIEKYDIKVISVNVVLDNKSYREVDLDNVTFYEMMESTKEFPKSAQPAMTEMMEAFETPLKNGDDLLVILMSSELSGTFSTANMIKNELLEEYPDRKIEVVDSKTTCMEMGLRVVECAKAAMEGATLEEAMKVGEAVSENSKFLFTPATLDYLKKGGRIGGASALFGGILKIRPILTVKDGKVSVIEKVRTQAKAVNEIINMFKKELSEKSLGGIVIHHINCKDEAVKISQEFKEELGLDVTIGDIGPVIGVHVGPGALGIAYFLK